ncbi:unnamed protein product [Tuber aestivum]|uniref:Uncharacterized protein n=1 Tax=Tuber aestivum TaxID=59557 RepID=A0A292PIY1_9PEZI|nr:unnamed protein product [Tuber aestivum]
MDQKAIRTVPKRPAFHSCIIAFFFPSFFNQAPLPLAEGDEWDAPIVQDSKPRFSSFPKSLASESSSARHGCCTRVLYLLIRPAPTCFHTLYYPCSMIDYRYCTCTSTIRQRRYF